MRALLVVALAACGAAPRPPSLALARVEAARDPAPLAGRRDPAALHALGRIGGPAAMDELRAALASTDEATVVAAIEGLWFADEPGAGAAVAPFAADGRAPVRLAALRALGRLGTAAEEAALVRALTGADLRGREVAGVAAGVMGRRKVATDATLAALVENSAHADAGVRRGAAYGLSFHPGNAGGWEALARLCDDPSVEVRALAYGGLGRANQGGVERVARGLVDPSPWVRAEAARALSGDKTSAPAHARLAAWLEKAPEEHAAIEGMLRIVAFSREEAVRGALGRMRAGTGPLACLAAAGLARAGEPLAVLDKCEWQRERLLADAVKAGGGLPAERLPAIEALARSPDGRARAAAAEVAPSFLPDPRADAIVRADLDSEELAIAGAAADAVGELGDKAPPWLVPTLIERGRAARALDPALFLSFLGALGTLKAHAALPLAAMATGDANATVRATARTVYKELAGEEAPPATLSPSAPPPVDLAALTARHPVLEIESTKGTFRIELDAEQAPWNVATLVTLARKGFYDGLTFHRVVPGFVVQGGDPTGTGWGGPGFVVPAEMSATPYVRGTVGIADSGRDTGGCQIFVMHAPAPHLDGRYTAVGHVPERDMPVVDKLIVGDRMLKVRVK